jgi:TRAP-type mannitol/chloroaromatic compound transport system permease small subunit
LRNIVEAIDKLNQFFLKVSVVLMFALVILTFEQVLARYVFGESSIWIQELQWHLFGAIFMLAAPAAYKLNEHVRVDVFSEKMTPSQKNSIEIFGILFFLIPTASVLIYYGWNFAASSLDYEVPYLSRMNDMERFFYSTILSGEKSANPGGLPARWVIKIIIPISGGLVFLQGISELYKLLTSSEVRDA